MNLTIIDVEAGSYMRHRKLVTKNEKLVPNHKEAEALTSEGNLTANTIMTRLGECIKIDGEDWHIASVEGNGTFAQRLGQPGPGMLVHTTHIARLQAPGRTMTIVWRSDFWYVASYVDEIMNV